MGATLQQLLKLGAFLIAGIWALDKACTPEPPNLACLSEHAKADGPCICGKVGSIRTLDGEIASDVYVGLPGVAIRATGDGSENSTLTDAQGAYQIRLPKSDMYLVEAIADQTQSLGATFAIPHSEERPQRCIKASFPVPATGAIRGRLLYSGGEPATEPDLFLYEKNKSNPHYPWCIWRDSTGRSAIARLGAGEYAVGVNPKPGLEVPEPDSIFFPGGKHGSEVQYVVVVGTEIDLGDLVIERPQE